MKSTFFKYYQAFRFIVNNIAPQNYFSPQRSPTFYPDFYHYIRIKKFTTEVSKLDLKCFFNIKTWFPRL